MVSQQKLVTFAAYLCLPIVVLMHMLSVAGADDL